MIEKEQIQQLTSNFPNLQGLKQIPISLLLIMIILWANEQTGQSRNLTLPLMMLFSMGLMYLFVHQYYRLSFGTIKQTSQKRRVEILISFVAGLLALGAFILDTSRMPPVSLLGIFWVILLIVDGYRIHTGFSRKPFPFFWIFAIIMAGCSILPLLGGYNWWQRFGLHDQVSAILIIASLMMFVSGFLWHHFLVSNLSIEE